MAKWCEFEIIRMYGADETRLTHSELPKALADLQVRGWLNGLQIFPDAEPALDGHWQYPRISVGWYAEAQGYLTQCFETVYSDSFFLATSCASSQPEIYVSHGSQGQELWPRRLFVPYQSTLQALEHFLATGLQDTRLDWVGIGAFPRRFVQPKPRR